jgi:hypothetical protein
MNNQHPFKLLKNPFDGTKCQIDEMLVPFIKALWKNGIRTNFCCQSSGSTHLPIVTTGMTPHAYVMFRNADAFQKLIDLLNRKATPLEFELICNDGSDCDFKFKNFVQRPMMVPYGVKHKDKQRYNVAPMMYSTPIGYQLLVNILKRK